MRTGREEGEGKGRRAGVWRMRTGRKGKGGMENKDGGEGGGGLKGIMRGLAGLCKKVQKGLWA